MALPPSFQNSFWTPDHRLDKTLWPKLKAGIVENQELLRLVTDRANAANDTSKALYSIADARLKSNGFAYDEGASLRRTFEGLKEEVGQVAKAHETVATNLDHMVLRPFTTWSHAHEGRVTDLMDQLDSATKDWEGLSHEVRKLKEARNAKCSLLDDAEEDLRFAPTSPTPTFDVASTSASGTTRGRSESAASSSSQSGLRWDTTQAAHAAQQATTAASNLARSLTQRVKVTPTAHAVKTRFERMRAEAREKELASRGQEADVGGRASALLEKEELLDEEGGRLGKMEKQAIAEAHLQPALSLKTRDDTKVQIDQLEIAGVVKHPRDWSIIFAKAKTQIPTTAVKVPLIGTTPDAHSGEDLVLWFKDNLDALGSSLSRSHEFCRQLSEELAILRLVGEIGNKFFDSSDAFYAWRPEAFQLDDVQNQINDAVQKGDKEKEVEEVNLQAPLTEIPAPMKERRSPNSPLLSPKLKPQPILPGLPAKNGVNGGVSSPPSAPTSPRLASGLSRSNTITSYLSSAYEKAASNVSSLNAKVAKVAGTGAASERLDRLKRDALDAEDDYRVAVQDLEDARLRLEELFSSTLTRAQKLEFDRLKAIKSVITTYNGTLASLNTPLQLSSERSALLSESFVPASDLNTVIEQYKTGTFRPRPNVWTDFYHETTDVRFGVDLKHWHDMNAASDAAGGGESSNKKQKIPDVFEQLLDTLRAGYPNLKDDAERRRTWIYEVPLPYTHRLRNLLNVAGAPLPLDELRGFDLPVLASCVKLYMLELAVSVIPSNLYAEVKAIYPTVGAESLNQETRTKCILELLERVPKVHLVVLDALLVHLSDLIALTPSKSKQAEGESQATPVESDAEFAAKLGATLGPCILRPPTDNSKTLNDRFPAQLFVDLLRDYAELLPPTLEKKAKVEEERYAPKRQRTKMVDQRVTRSTTAAKDNRKHSDWLKEELERKMGHKIAEEPDELHKSEETSGARDDAPQSVQDALAGAGPELPAKTVSPQAQAEPQTGNDDVNEKEQLEIPPAPGFARTVSATSENQGTGGDRTPGFVTPTEQPGSPRTEESGTEQAKIPELHPVADSGEKKESEKSTGPTSPELLSPSTPTLATTGQDEVGAEAAGSPTVDDDKPLVASASLLRSSTGSSARRVPAPLSRSGATRGPRPMSVHGPQSSAGGSTGSNTSAAAGVRARAAMFEQRGAPSPK